MGHIFKMKKANGGTGGGPRTGPWGTPGQRRYCSGGLWSGKEDSNHSVCLSDSQSPIHSVCS